MQPVTRPSRQPLGHLDLAARRAMVAPVSFGLLLTLLAIFLGPWSAEHRLALMGCVLVGFGCVLTEYVVRWENLPTGAYLPVPVVGLLDVGVGMWASGGWTSPFIAFLTLPAAYAVTAADVLPALPVAVLAGLVMASPGLYTPHTSFVVAALGSVPAYCTLVLTVGAIMRHLRRSDELALAESRARRQSEARARDLLTLQRTSAIVAGHLSMDDALTAIVSELSRAFGHSLLSIYLRQGDDLKMQVQMGYTTYFETILPGVGVIGTAYDRGDTIFIRDVASDSAYREATDGVRSEIAVPLRDNGRVVGVLNVESRDTLTDHDRDLVELFSTLVSVVLQNARMAGELRRRAERDPLTGLLNHRALVETLEATLRAGEQGCGVLVVDLDNFKQINDTHGHLVGDAVLQHVARLLAQSCRAEDHCGRYGGDEFVVIVPGADGGQTRSIAERISEAMQSRPFLGSADRIIVPTVSIGIAHAPEDGSSRADLLSHADREMYRAKRSAIQRQFSA